MDDVRCRENHDIRVSQQQIGQADIETAGDRSVLDQKALGSFDIQEIVGPPQILIPEFETMIAFQPVQVLNQVPGLGNLVLRPPGCRTYGPQAGKEERRYARGSRPIRNS